MDLKVIEQVQKLTWNFDEVKAELTNHIEKYVGLVVNDENLSDMEKTQKEIAGLRTKLQKFRLAVKKDLERPYNAFELQIKELAGLVESAESPIKDQLEKYEVLRRESKAVEVQEMIDSISAELGLAEQYKQQIVIADKYLNRTQKKNDTKEDIQQKVCWLLDIQNKAIAEEANRVEKINMAKMMCEFLSKDLITPYSFADVENKIESLNITELRTYIENKVAIRKEQEEKAKQLAEQQLLQRQEEERLAEVARIEQEEKVKQLSLERAEQERIAEVARQENIEQARLAEVERQVKIVEIEDKQPDIVFDVVEQQEVVKKYNAQFVLYNISENEVKNIESVFNNLCIDFKHQVKEVQ